MEMSSVGRFSNPFGRIEANSPDHARDIFWLCQISTTPHHNHPESILQYRRDLLVLGG